MHQGFDNDKYLTLQAESIRNRISMFDGKLYLEFGGKLFDDYHASRVLPGFHPDSKLQMLSQLKDESEIIIAINVHDMEQKKIRGDLGITYDSEVIRLFKVFSERGFYVSSVVLTHYEENAVTLAFQSHLEQLGLKVYHHYLIQRYPTDLPHIISEEGFGKNEYIETIRKLVVVTAPGPGSGKMATCLSQMYHEHKRGIRAGYAKFETFPIWNLPLSHPVNIAYEAATADLKDVNMIDPFHLEAYGKVAINYNRDVESFPVLSAMFEEILGMSPYKSPTDMGVNMAGYCIVNSEEVEKAAKEEILRRYYLGLCNQKLGKTTPEEVETLALLLKKVSLSPEDRKVVPVALATQKAKGVPIVAGELSDGTILTGKESTLLSAPSALILNLLKYLSHIDDEIFLMSPQVLEPILQLKTQYLGSNDPRLHIEDTLLALAICATSDVHAKLALDQLAQLQGCEMHSTEILSPTDEKILKKLGVYLTCEPKERNE